MSSKWDLTEFWIKAHDTFHISNRLNIFGCNPLSWNWVEFKKNQKFYEWRIFKPKFNRVKKIGL